MAELEVTWFFFSIRSVYRQCAYDPKFHVGNWDEALCYIYSVGSPIHDRMQNVSRSAAVLTLENCILLPQLFFLPGS